MRLSFVQGTVNPSTSQGQSPSGILVHGVGFTVTGSGLGFKNGGLIFWDRGTDPVGTVNSAYFQANPSGLATLFPSGNMQNQVATTFSPTSAGPPGTNDPFNPHVLAGCGYIVNVSNQGEDVDVNLTFSASAPTFPSALYASFDHKVDPAWVLGLAPDGVFDDNLKLTNYNQGPDDYGTNFRYWAYGKAGSAGASGNVDKIKVGVQVQGLQNSIAQSPDNNGHVDFWPASGDNWPEVAGAVNPYFSQWITYQNRVTISNNPAVGQDILWQQPCARSQTINQTFGQITNYNGITDDTTATRRSYTFGGFNRSGGNAGTPTPTQFRYIQNPLLDFEPGQIDVPRLIIGDAPTWDACTQRQYQKISSGGWVSTSVTCSDFWQARYLIGQTVYPYLWLGNGTLVAPSGLTPPQFTVAPFTTFDFFVSPSGSDTNTGTSVSSPWAITSLSGVYGVGGTTAPFTAQGKANWALTAGKKVGIMPGTYNMSQYMATAEVHGGPPVGALQIIGGTSGTAPTYWACCDSNGNYSPRSATFVMNDNGIFGGSHSTAVGIGTGPLIAHTGRFPTAYATGFAVIDGLRIVGGSFKSIMIGDGSYENAGQGYFIANPVLVRNCEITGMGFNPGDNVDNCCAIWVDHNVNAVTIDNNWIHDNSGHVANGGDHLNAIIVWGFGQISAGPCTGTVITRNTCVRAGNIYGKEGQIQGTTVAYNYVDVSNLTSGGNPGIQDFTGWNVGGLTLPTSIHHNVIITSGNNSAGNVSFECLGGLSTKDITGGAWITPANVYNNTVVNVTGSNSPTGPVVAVGSVSTGSPGVGAYKFWNNLYANPAGFTGSVNGWGNYRMNPQAVGVWDYNLSPASGVTWVIAQNGSTSTTLTSATSPSGFGAALAASGGISGAEAHSIAGTPTFVGTGLYAAQYQLAAGSLGKGTGSNNGTTTGSATDMGAWGNGATQVGCNFAT